jgi:hypothetical protein
MYYWSRFRPADNLKAACVSQWDVVGIIIMPCPCRIGSQHVPRSVSDSNGVRQARVFGGLIGVSRSTAIPDGAEGKQCVPDL